MRIDHVDRSLNTYLDITSACNASCPFCIAETAGRRNGKDIFEGVDWALDFTEQHGGTLQIVGGEPSISSRLPGVFERMEGRFFRRVVLNTNGARDVYKAAASVRTTHVNFSRHHWDETLNQSVMNQRPLLSNDDLARRIESARTAGLSVRLQAVLLPGLIDSADKIIKFAQWSRSLGAHATAVSQAFPLHELRYQREPVPGYTASAQMDLARIVRDLDSITSLTIANDLIARDEASTWGSGGGNYAWWGPAEAVLNGHRRHWLLDAHPVSLKTFAGFDVHGMPRQGSYDPACDNELQPGVVSFVVVHPNGVVTASWNEAERVMFSPKGIAAAKKISRRSLELAALGYGRPEIAAPSLASRRSAELSCAVVEPTSLPAGS